MPRNLTSHAPITAATFLKTRRCFLLCGYETFRSSFLSVWEGWRNRRSRWFFLWCSSSGRRFTGLLAVCRTVVVRMYFSWRFARIGWRSSRFCLWWWWGRGSGGPWSYHRSLCGLLWGLETPWSSTCIDHRANGRLLGLWGGPWDWWRRIAQFSSRTDLRAISDNLCARTPFASGKHIDPCMDSCLFPEAMPSGRSRAWCRSPRVDRAAWSKKCCG